MKKVFALLLALIMVMSLATTAFATGTIKNDTDRIYAAYQIFTGTQAEGSAVLGDVDWGEGINVTTFLPALKALTVNNTQPFKDCTDAASVAEVLAKCENNSAIAKAFANLAEQHLGTSRTSVGMNMEVNFPEGYWLLVDTSTLDENETANPALLQVTNNTSLAITLKNPGTPTPDKTILGVTDASGNPANAGDTGDAATAGIGDIVTFKLSATLPDDLSDYETYKLIFHDTLSAGLQFNGNFEFSRDPGDENVQVDNDGHTITITYNDLIAMGVQPGEEITVTYDAIVTSAAVIGKNGNTNEVYLEYSNDPNDESKTTTTPPDTVIVFTFELDVTKVDGQDATKKLSGAQFVLLNEAQNKVAVIDNGKIATWQTVPSGGNWIAASILTSDENGMFAVEGLDQGTYYLKEIVAPAGYNLLTTPVKLVITATVNDTEDTQSLEALTIKVGDHEAKAGDASTGVVGATIENNAGTTLPETGGMGTTLFYVFGGIMMLGALVLLVTKKRMADIA